MILRMITFVSFMLFVLTCVAWRMSYPHGDEIYLPVHRGTLVLANFEGRIGLMWYGMQIARETETLIEIRTNGIDGGSMCYWLTAKFLGFGYRSKTGSPPISLYAPNWFFAFVFAILPARELLKFSKHPVASLCKTCGYDLRASKDRCPECGRVIDTLLKLDKQQRLKNP